MSQIDIENIIIVDTFPEYQAVSSKMHSTLLKKTENHCYSHEIRVGLGYIIYKPWNPDELQFD